MSIRIFISHASEDKAAIVRPLARLLRERGFNIWYDEFSLELGDSLRRSIEQGLHNCDFGVIVLSDRFLAKEWPQRELDGLLGREDDGRKVILPLLHQVSFDRVRRDYPMLAGRVALSTDADLVTVADRIESAVTREMSQRRQQSSTVGIRYVIKLDIDGSAIKESLRGLVTDSLGISASDIKKIVVRLFDDLSGVDTSSSRVIFQDGGRWPVSSESVLAGASRILTTIQPTYQPIAWEVSQESRDLLELEEEGMSLDLAGYTVSVLFGREYHESLPKEEVRAYLRALADLGNLYSAEPDVWWIGASIGRKLINRLLREGDYRFLVELMKNYGASPMRAGFLAARAIIEELEPSRDGKAEELLRYLLSEASTLNDYWKEALRKKLGPSA